MMVETWEFDDEDCVHVFGHEVSVDVQRPETHSCIGDGMLIESLIAGSSIEQRDHKKVHMKERGFDTWVVSNRLVLVRMCWVWKLIGHRWGFIVRVTTSRVVSQDCC